MERGWGQAWETCESTIRAWIESVVSGLGDELGDNLVGVYLHGSLASGSFYPPKSDLDLLFVASTSLSAAQRRSFAVRCVQLHRARPITGGLECSVVLEAETADPTHPMPFEVHFGENRVDDIVSGAMDHAVSRTDPDLAAHCQALREFGRALRGPPIARVFGPVRRADFIDSVRGDIEWIIADRHVLDSPVYAVLNACRALWLEDGTSPRLAPSKEEAALWAAEWLPAEHRPLVLCALDVYRDDANVGPEDRRTGGRSWSHDELLVFRDWLRSEVKLSRFGVD